MLVFLARLWIIVLMVIAAILSLTAFGLVTVTDVIMAVLWGLLAISLLVSLIMGWRAPTP